VTLTPRSKVKIKGQIFPFEINSERLHRFFQKLHSIITIQSDINQQKYCDFDLKVKGQIFHFAINHEVHDLSQNEIFDL